VRLVRILKMVHVLQAFRQFDALRRMVYAVLNSLHAMLWVIILNGAATYVFSIYVCQAIAIHLQTEREWATDHVERRFGDIWKTMMTIFMSFTGGLDWAEVMDLLLSMNLLHGFLYLLFIVFVVMGLLNVVTGLFVESACAIVERDRVRILDSVAEEERAFKVGMTEVFHLMDIGETGYLELEELKTTLENEDTRLLLASHGLPCRNALQLFTLLDEDGSGKIKLDAFLDKCGCLKGTSKSIDVMSLQLDVHRILSQVCFLIIMLCHRIAESVD